MPVPPPESPFTHAVASFDPTDEAVLLWTRVVGAPRLRWWVARGADGTRPLAGGEVEVPSDADGCTTVEATGLPSGESLWYGFTVVGGPDDGAVSPVGRTRTMPAVHASLGAPEPEVRLAVVSCTDLTNGHFGAYRSLAEHEVDLVVHVGDYIYETDGKGDVRTNVPDRTVTSLDDYRRRFGHTRSDPDLLSLHLRHPMVFVWDDHDVADNAWRHGAKEHDPDRHGRWEDRLAAAARARQEWVPARLRDPSDLYAMWRSLPLGPLGELVLLDTRIPGRDRQAGDPGAKALEADDRHLLDAAQREWAAERIADTERPWCLLASAVVVNPMQLPVAPEQVDLLDPRMPSGYAVVDGVAMCTDEWDGYPAERRWLTERLAARGGGSVIVSGDVHSSWAFEGPRDADGRAVAVELVAPAVSSTPMGRQLPAATRELAELAADGVEHCVWSDLTERGWLRVAVRPDVIQADWFAVDADAIGPEAVPLASWRARPDLPARLEPAGQPLAPRPDRGGLPLDVLPARPTTIPAPSRGSSHARSIAALAGVAGLAVASWAWHRACRRPGGRFVRRPGGCRGPLAGLLRV